MAEYDRMNDLELVNLIKSGNKRAFAQIYDRYFGVLYLHAYRQLRDKDEAKDLLQDLFSYLWSHRESLSPSSNFSHYLYMSVRNRVLNILAHKYVEDKFLLSLSHTGSRAEAVTDHRARERQLAVIIEQEIQLLPPKMREVFELSRKANLSHKEIAVRLGLSEQSVRSHVKGALRLLRSRLGLWVYLCMIAGAIAGAN
ncbi:RNA polymerase sigma-70 factor [Chitinophaga eiseniae]|uniref:RNA polymerase sigma-70 factor n=1 Tax=Chitinophaga eiseniae TaxID=634771 RepID=A0A847SQT1_9BACT|nr:RNA polymerase sigma-70 factor [Chitinophaga eiseniae]NLR78432.1 RNA polymerase sigma-70 factor [Chitinophaga eiseniae]